MATNAKSVNVDLNSVFEGAASQFRGLNANEPGPMANPAEGGDLGCGLRSP